MLSVFASGLDKLARVEPFRTSDKCCHDIRTKSFAIAHDGVLRFLAEVANKENARINAAQLFEKVINGVEKLLASRGVANDGVNHLVVTCHHFIELASPFLVSTYGHLRCGDKLVGDTSQCTNNHNHGLSLSLGFHNAL